MTKAKATPAPKPAEEAVPLITEAHDFDTDHEGLEPDYEAEEVVVMPDEAEEGTE